MNLPGDQCTGPRNDRECPLETDVSTSERSGLAGAFTIAIGMHAEETNQSNVNDEQGP